MPNYFKAMEEKVNVVNEVFEKSHKQRLDGAKIAVICRDKAAKRNGCAIWATASLLSPRMKPLLSDTYHFVITISADIWPYLTGEQQYAVIDHELCHCQFDDDGEPEMRPHDVEEFAEVIQRHGFYKRDGGEAMFQHALVEQGYTIDAPELATADA